MMYHSNITVLDEIQNYSVTENHEMWGMQEKLLYIIYLTTVRNHWWSRFRCNCSVATFWQLGKIRSVTMSYNESGTCKKRTVGHPEQQVHILSLLRGLIAQRNLLSPHSRPLSTAVLVQTTNKLPKHHVAANAKSRKSLALGILLLLS